MTIMLAIYGVLLLAGLVYAGINIFHVVRFRLPGDSAYIGMSVYLLILAGVVVVSASAAILVYQL